MNNLFYSFQQSLPNGLISFSIDLSFIEILVNDFLLNMLQNRLKEKFIEITNKKVHDLFIKRNARMMRGWL